MNSSAGYPVMIATIVCIITIVVKPVGGTATCGPVITGLYRGACIIEVDCNGLVLCVGAIGGQVPL